MDGQGTDWMENRWMGRWKTGWIERWKVGWIIGWWNGKVVDR